MKPNRICFLCHPVHVHSSLASNCSAFTRLHQWRGQNNSSVQLQPDWSSSAWQRRSALHITEILSCCASFRCGLSSDPSSVYSLSRILEMLWLSRTADLFLSFHLLFMGPTSGKSFEGIRIRCASFLEIPSCYLQRVRRLQDSLFWVNLVVQILRYFDPYCAFRLWENKISKTRFSSRSRRALDPSWERIILIIMIAYWEEEAEL